MEQTQALGEGQVTFEQFMAGMREFRKSQEEANQQFRETLQKSQEEAGRQLRETLEKSLQISLQKSLQITLEKSREEFDRQMKESAREFNKRFGELTNRFGDMVEYMVVPNLVTKFEELGFTFTKANRTEIKDREHGIFTEIDALLENGEKVMAVEIKTKPNIDDIHNHVDRMEKLRAYADLRNDKRIYLGAVAGVVFSDNDKIYALKKGFYVIEPSGDTFTITEPKGKYHPREW